MIEKKATKSKKKRLRRKTLEAFRKQASAVCATEDWSLYGMVYKYIQAAHKAGGYIEQVHTGCPGGYIEQVHTGCPGGHIGPLRTDKYSRKNTKKLSLPYIVVVFCHLHPTSIGTYLPV